MSKYASAMFLVVAVILCCLPNSSNVRAVTCGSALETCQHVSFEERHGGVANDSYWYCVQAETYKLCVSRTGECTLAEKTKAINLADSAVKRLESYGVNCECEYAMQNCHAKYSEQVYNMRRSSFNLTSLVHQYLKCIESSPCSEQEKKRVEDKTDANLRYNLKGCDADCECTVRCTESYSMTMQMIRHPPAMCRRAKLYEDCITKTNCSKESKAKVQQILDAEMNHFKEEYNIDCECTDALEVCKADYYVDILMLNDASVLCGRAREYNKCVTKATCSKQNKQKVEDQHSIALKKLEHFGVNCDNYGMARAIPSTITVIMSFFGVVLIWSFTR